MTQFDDISAGGASERQPVGTHTLTETGLLRRSVAYLSRLNAGMMLFTAIYLCIPPWP